MHITPEARQILEDILEENEDGFIRVGRLASGAGCGLKIRLGVTLDEFFDAEDDIRMEVAGLPVVVEKMLRESLADTTICIGEDGIMVSGPGCGK